MFCTKCGEKIPDKSLFCPKCGKKQGEIKEPAFTEPKKQFELTRYRPFIWCFIGLILLGVIWGIITLVINANSQNITLSVFAFLATVTFIAYWFYIFSKDNQPSKKEIATIVIISAMVFPLIAVGLLSISALTSGFFEIVSLLVVFILFIFCAFTYSISAVLGTWLAQHKPNLTVKHFAACFFVLLIANVILNVATTETVNENDLQITSFGWESVVPQYSLKDEFGYILFAKPKIIITTTQNNKYLQFRAMIDGKLVNYYNYTEDPYHYPGIEEGWDSVWDAGEKVVIATPIPITWNTSELQICFRLAHRPTAGQFCKTKVIDSPKVALQLSKDSLNFTFNLTSTSNSWDKPNDTITFTNIGDYKIDSWNVIKEVNEESNFYGSFDCSSITLAPGESKTCTFTPHFSAMPVNKQFTLKYIVGPYGKPLPDYQFTKEIIITVNLIS